MFAFISFNYRVPIHLGGHVGVDADGWEHGEVEQEDGEVEQEVPACEENQGGREGPGQMGISRPYTNCANTLELSKNHSNVCYK